MKIYADSFKRWSRVLESYQEKGNPIGESLYLDFTTEYAFFGSKDGIGRIKFYIEKEDNEKIDNFFISTVKFLNIITQYDYVTLSSNFLIKNGNDKYKLTTIVDDDKIDTSPFLKLFDSRLDFNKDSIEKITKALIFTNKDEQNTNYRNIFIQDNYICSLTTQTPMYESPIDITNDIGLQINVAKTLVQVGSIAEGCYVMTSSVNKKIVSRDDEIEIIVPSNSSFEFPSNRSQDFINSYSYDTKLKLQTDVFSKVLSSLRPYFNDVLNAKLYMTIGDDIVLRVQDSTNDIEKHIPYVEVSEELIGHVYSISGTKLEIALSVLRGKELFICLPTDENSPIVNLYCDESQHVLIVRFKNENS